MVSGLLAGHATFHWIIQSFVVALPEIQSAFNLNSVGVGGVLSARELAAGQDDQPGGVVVDLLRRYWGVLLADCLGAAGLGSLIMGISPVYPLLLVGIGVVAIAHSLWHLPASTSLSHHFAQRRGMALAFHGVGGSIGDVAGPIATGALLLFLGWRGLLNFYAVVPLFLAFLALWFFRGIGRDGERETPGVTLSGRVALTRRLLQSPTLWGLTVVRGLRTMALVALLTALPLYLGNDTWNSAHFPGGCTSACSSPSACWLNRRRVIFPTAGDANRSWCPAWSGLAWRPWPWRLSMTAFC